MSDTMLMMLVAVTAELVLLLFVFMTIALLRGRSAKKRDADAMRALVARVKKEKPQREQAIEKFLAHGMAMSGDALEQAKVAMLRAELALLQRFVGIYRGRDVALAARFDGDVIAALEPYHALTGTGPVDADSSDDTATDSTEIEALRKENSRLEDELRITMETMSRMLNEYSTMFAGGAPDHAAPIAGVAAAATVADAVADDVAEVAEPIDGDLDGFGDPPELDIAVDTDLVAGDSEQVDAPDAVDELFAGAAGPEAEPADMDIADDVEDLFDELPEEPEEAIAPADVEMPDDPDLEAVAEGVIDPDDLFDTVESTVSESEPEPETRAESEPVPDPEPEPEPELLSDPDITALDEDLPGEEPDGEEDPIAQILREAQSQEQSARGSPVDVASAPPPAAAMSDDAPAADVLLEEGDIEVMSFAEDQVDIGGGDEELFDAVDIDGPEFDAPTPPADSGEDLFDAVDDDLKRGSAT